MKIRKKWGGWVGGVGLGGRVEGGQAGCERRIEVFCENSKQNFYLFFFFLGGGGPGGRVGGVRVDVNEELKFL